MGWYTVIKTINGHRYLYLQSTYREGGKVKTRNKYIGPAGDGIGFSMEPRPKPAIADDLDQAIVHRDILGDIVDNHRVKPFLKYRGRMDKQATGGTSFAELNAQALETGAKGKILDTMLSEAGFDSFEELDEAVEEYFSTKEQLESAKRKVAQLRKERAEAAAYDRALGMRLNQESITREIKEPAPKPDKRPTLKMRPVPVRQKKPAPRPKPMPPLKTREPGRRSDTRSRTPIMPALGSLKFAASSVRRTSNASICRPTAKLGNTTLSKGADTNISKPNSVNLRQPRPAHIKYRNSTPPSPPISSAPSATRRKEMLQALLDRLRLTYEDDGYDVKDYALKIQERQTLKDELMQAKEERIKDLAAIEEMEFEMDMNDALSETEGETE